MRLTRRLLFTKILSPLARRLPRRFPPTAATDYSKRCDGCGACLKACAYGILSIEEGLAVVQEGGSACRLCADQGCAAACDRGALEQAESIEGNSQGRMAWD